MDFTQILSRGTARTMLVGASFILVSGVHAATLDLAGVGTNITDVAELADYDCVTNSVGGDPVTLTFNLATDMAYAGTISGNIRLVKNGNGFLNLSGNNTYTGGTQIDDGRLIASSLTAFGATTGAITVNSDCNGYNSYEPISYSNNVVCVVFGCAGNFAYPINTSAWTNPTKKPNGYAGITYYNVAVTVDGVTLSGKITGGGLSVHFGGLEWSPNASTAGSGSLTISGDIDCSSGTCSFNTRAQPINITGKVTTLAIYQTYASQWPSIWQLGGTGNVIGVIDVGGGTTSGDRSLTASTRDALGGAMVYAAGEITRSHSVKISADQTVESFSMKPSGTYSGGSLAANSGRHYVQATAAATVTMLGTNNRTNDWCLKDAGATKAMSLVWNPTGNYTYTCVGHANTVNGTITVSGGTFEVGDSCSFPNVTAISVASGATLKVSSDTPFSSSVTIEAEPGATLNLAADITAATVKVGDHYLSAKGFSAGTYKGLTIAGAGSLVVSSKPGGEDTYTWTGGGADDNITTTANWQNSDMPDFDDEAPFIVFAGGTAAVLDRDISASGVTFYGVTAFNLSASGNHVLSLGAGGISNAPAASASAVTVSAPVMPLVDQVWQMETNVTFTLSGVLKKYGTSAPTITVRQSSYADPTITFVGSSTPEGASDFAGDIVFEETALANGKYGTAYVRASGHEPFGPDGNLKLMGSEAGQNVNAVRTPYLYLSNAVISKAVQYGPYNSTYYCADDNTTNVMNGAFTPTRRGTGSGITGGTFPPKFQVGTNAVLRLCGNLDFGDRTTANDADVHLFSSSSATATKPTGKVVFDGRITKLPLRLKLDHAVGLELNASENAITNLYLRHGDTLPTGPIIRFGTSYALSNGLAMVTFPTYASAPVDFDLNGTLQHVKGFAQGKSGTTGAGGCRILSSGSPGTLRISQPNDVVFEGSVETNVTIQMEGAATLTFSHETAFKAGSTLAVSNGTVAVSSATALNEDVSLKLLGGKISIPEGQTALVGETFYLDANGDLKPLPRGSYGSGDGKIGSFFASGSGSIRVKKGPGHGFVLIYR